MSDNYDYFKRLHECILTKASRELVDADLIELFEITEVDLSDETLELMRRYRISQLEQRLMMGDLWQESDFVFTREDGSPLRPDSITQWLAKFSRRHDLPHINPHAFRHTAASVLISHGTDIVTVSKMLGHSKVSTTEDIYAHVIEESKQQAGNLLADIYYHGMAKTGNG